MRCVVFTQPKSFSINLQTLTVKPRVQFSKYMTLTGVAILGGIRLSLIFAALRLAPMTIVHTMLTGTPIAVMILSAFMLKNSDKCTLLKVLASCLFLAGVTLSHLKIIKDFANITPVSVINSHVLSYRNITMNRPHVQ